MRALFVLSVVAICAASNLDRSYPFTPQNYSDISLCEQKDVHAEYRSAHYEFSVKLYKIIGERSNYHFVNSPLSTWLILASLAEGADPSVQQRTFRYLQLPTDRCTREMYYAMLNYAITMNSDAKFYCSHTLVLDQDTIVNPYWAEFALRNAKLGVAYAPIKKYPLLAANFMRKLMKAPLRRLNLSGNSVILDSTHYKGLWKTAFDESVIQRSPFYNLMGQKIGTVDLMRIKKRVKMAYVPAMDMQIMELPIGRDGKYCIVFGLILSKTDNLHPHVNLMSSLLIIQMLTDLKETTTPIEVAIPRFTMTSEVDITTVLRDLSLWTMWTDPAATKFVSRPAALPSSYIQRSTVTMDSRGASHAPQSAQPSYNTTAGLNKVDIDFIANRPFLFSLMDTETGSCLLTGSYSQPTYPY